MGNAHGSPSRNDEGKNVEIFVKSAISHHGKRKKEVFIAISFIFCNPTCRAWSILGRLWRGGPSGASSSPGRCCPRLSSLFLKNGK